MEKKEEVRTFITRKYCDCGGELKSTGESFTSNPRQYVHQCDKCGIFDKISGIKYPIISYESINTQENG